MRGVVQRHQPLAPALAAHRDEGPPAAAGDLRQARPARRRAGPSRRAARAARRRAAPRGRRAGVRLRRRPPAPRAASSSRSTSATDRIFGRCAARLRPLGGRGRIVVRDALGDQKAEELPERRKPPRLRARGEPALRQRRRDRCGRPPAVAAASRPASLAEILRGRGDRRRACWRSRRARPRASRGTLRAAPASRACRARGTGAHRSRLQPVGRDAHGHFALLRLDQDHQRDHAAIDDRRDQAEHHQQSNETRHRSASSPIRVYPVPPAR